MLKVEGIRSVNWNAPNPAEAERFYTEILGGKVVARNQVRGVDVTRVQLGSAVIGLFDAPYGAVSGVPHQTLRMSWPADQDAIVAQLEAAGVHVDRTRPHREGAGFSVFIDDPLGNHLELSWDPPEVTLG